MVFIVENEEPAVAGGGEGAQPLVDRVVAVPHLLQDNAHDDDIVHGRVLQEIDLQHHCVPQQSLVYSPAAPGHWMWTACIPEGSWLCRAYYTLFYDCVLLKQQLISHASSVLIELKILRGIEKCTCCRTMLVSTTR